MAETATAAPAPASAAKTSRFGDPLKAPPAAPPAAAAPPAVPAKSRFGDPLQKPPAQELPTAGELPAGPEAVTDELGNAISKAEKKVGERLLAWQGKLAGVDYSGANVPFWLRADVNRMDNAKEAKLWAEDLFGRENVATDPAGRVIVLPNGFVYRGVEKPKQPVAVWGYDPGVSWGRAGAGMISMAPQMAGMIGLQMIPGLNAVADASLLGRVTLSAAGAVGGKGIAEFAKYRQGYYAKTPSELYNTLVSEAIGGVVSEGVMAALRAPAKALYGVFNPSRRIPQNVKEDVAAALELGLVPSISQATAGKSGLWRIAESRARQLFTSPADKLNFYTMNDQMKNLLVKAGVPEGEVPAAMNAILRGDIPMAELNINIRNAVRTYVGELDALRNADVARANTIISNQLAAIEKAMPAAADNAETGAAVKRAIGTAKETFDGQAAALYAQVDGMVGDVPLVPTARLKDVANDIMAKIPMKPVLDAQGRPVLDAAGQPLKEPAVGQAFYNQLKSITEMDDFLTFSQMQFARRTFREAAYSDKVVANVPQHELGLMKQAADRAFGDVAISIPGEAAVRALRTADKFYAENVGKFQELLINQLARDVKSGGAVRPERVVFDIMTDDAGSQVNRVHSLLAGTPEVWGHVQRTYWKQLTGDSLDPFTRQVSGAKLLDRLDRSASTLDATYGKQTAAEMREYAKRLAAVDGKVDPSIVTDVNFKRIVESIEQHKAKISEFMDTHFLAALAKPGALSDEAIWYVLRPGNTDRLKQAMQFFESTNPAVGEKIRQTAMQNILKDVIKNPSAAFMDVFDGVRLEKSLRQYSHETLLALYGRDMVADLEKFARAGRLLTATAGTQNLGTSLSAAAMALHPLSHLHGLAGVWAESRLMANRTFLHWLALGTTAADPSVAAMSLRAVNMMAKNVTRAIGMTTGAWSAQLGEQPGPLTPAPAMP